MRVRRLVGGQEGPAPTEGVSSADALGRSAPLRRQA